jgi:hypothetical protein
MARRYEVNSEIVAPELRPVAEPVNTFMAPGVRPPVINEFLDLAPLSKGLTDLTKAWTEVEAENVKEQAKAAYGSSDPEIKTLIDKRKNGTLTDSESAKLMKAKEIPQAFFGQFYKNIDILAARDHLRDYRNELATHVERIGRVVKDTGRIDGMNPEEAIQKIQTDLWNKYSSKDLFKNSYWAQGEAGQARGAIDSEFSSAVTSVFTKELEAYEKASVGREIGDVLMSGYQNPEEFGKSVASLVDRFRSMPLVDMQAKIGQGGLAFIQAQLASKKITNSQAQSMVATLMAVKINDNELSRSNPEFAVDAANLLERIEAAVEKDETDKLRNIDNKGDFILDLLIEPMDPKLPMSERLSAAEEIINNPGWEYANIPSIKFKAQRQIDAARNPPAIEDKDTLLNLELLLDTESPELFKSTVMRAMEEGKINIDTKRRLIELSETRSSARGTVAADPKLRASKLEWAAEAGTWENQYGTTTAKFLQNAASKDEVWFEGQLLNLEADTTIKPEDKPKKRAELEVEVNTRRNKAIEAAKAEADDLAKQFKDYSLGGNRPNETAWVRAEGVIGATAVRLFEARRKDYTSFEQFSDRPNSIMNSAKRLVRTLGTSSTAAEGWLDVAEPQARMAAQELYRKLAKEGKADDTAMVLNAMEAEYKKSLRESLSSDSVLTPESKKDLFNSLFRGDPYGLTMDSAALQQYSTESKELGKLKADPDEDYDGDELGEFSKTLASNGTQNSKHNPVEVWGDEDTRDTFYKGFIDDTQSTGKLLLASDPRIGKNGATDLRYTRMKAMAESIGAAKDKRALVLEFVKTYGLTEEELNSGVLKNAPGFESVRIKGKSRMFDIRDLNPMLTPMFVDMPVSDFSAMLENANDSTTHDYTKLREFGLKLGIPDPEQTDEYGDLIDSNLDAWNDWLGALSTNYHRFAYTRHETPMSTVDAAADDNRKLELDVEQQEAIKPTEPLSVLPPQPAPSIETQLADAEATGFVAFDPQQDPVQVTVTVPDDPKISTLFTRLTDNYTAAHTVVKYAEDGAKRAIAGVDSWVIGKESSDKQTLSKWEAALQEVETTNIAVRLANEQAADTEFRKQKGLDRGTQYTIPTEIDKPALVRYAVWDNLNTHPAIVNDAQKLMYGKSGLLESVLKNVTYTANWSGASTPPTISVATAIPDWSQYSDEFISDFVNFYTRTDLEDYSISKDSLNALNSYNRSVSISPTVRKYNIPKPLFDSAVLYLSGMSQEDIDFVLQEEQ